MKKPEVVIIGSGLAGLTAGALLAEKGILQPHFCRRTFRVCTSAPTLESPQIPGSSVNNEFWFILAVLKNHSEKNVGFEAAPSF